MKGTFVASLRRPLIAALLIVSILAGSGTAVSASSVTTTVTTASLKCGVVASPAVHFVSTSPCVIRVRVGTYVHIKFRTGLRWSKPVSNARAVAVSVISRSSIGVNAATLHAAAEGRARVVATGTFYCKPGTMCPDLAVLWSLEVVVT